MRPDQRVRLEALTEALAEVVLVEADPASWPGAGVPLAELTRDQRGDRFWCKRNAAATLGLLERVQRTLTDAATTAGGARNTPEAERELAADIERSEREAAKLLANMQRRAANAGRAGT